MRHAVLYCNGPVNAPLDADVILLLLGLYGLFALSELALVSANRARFAVLARKGLLGAALACDLAENTQRLSPAVQVGITGAAAFAGRASGAHRHVSDGTA